MPHRKFHTHHHPHEKTGQLVVAGEGEIKMCLPRIPEHLHVEFLDEQVLIPCTPDQDTLTWDLDKLEKDEKNELLLTITWRVSGTRTIRWDIKY